MSIYYIKNIYIKMFIPIKIMFFICEIKKMIKKYI